VRNSIHFKLALALIAVTVLTALVLTIVFFSSNTNRFEQYVFDQQFTNKLLEVESFYAVNQSWEGVESVLSTTTAGHGFTTGQGRQGAGQGQGQPLGNNPVRQTEQANETTVQGPNASAVGRQYALADADGTVLVGIEGLYPEGETLTEENLEEGAPIIVDGDQVGTLLDLRRGLVLTQAEESFLERTNTGLLWALLITIVLAAILGILIARNLTKPVVELTQAAQKLASGDLSQSVDVRSSDELGKLSEAFNKMSAEIAQSDRLRKQMTADIAHDLRTPLTVIGGYIESMRDGDLEATPERLSLIYSEISRLNRLVGDLRLLSQSDAGELPMNLQVIEPNEILHQALEIFKLQAEQQSVVLLLETEAELPMVMADESRLIQVMENLIGNALRYTPAGGTVSLKASFEKNNRLENGRECVRFSVEDNGQGIPVESMPYVFERFHRVDKSRHSDEDQSGLGLAIVKAIVQSHGGKVWVESVVGKGTSFHFCIPTAYMKTFDSLTI
jgi:two-component system OmpR family sensor kinase/two-component system sensor histidine kinase BaeS